MLLGSQEGRSREDSGLLVRIVGMEIEERHERETETEVRPNEAALRKGIADSGFAAVEYAVDEAAGALACARTALTESESVFASKGMGVGRLEGHSTPGVVPQSTALASDR